MFWVILVVLFVGGVVLLYFGGQLFYLINDNVLCFFIGLFVMKMILLIVGGVVVLFVGLIGFVMLGGKC